MIRRLMLRGRRGLPGVNGTNGTNGTNGAPGANGTNGTNGASYKPGSPNAITVAIGTVYQATNIAKPAQVYVNLEQALTAAVTLVGAVIELRIGPSATGLAAGTSGFPVARTRTTLTGLLAVLGLLLGTGDCLTALVPTGWFFCVRYVSGSGATVASAFDQPLT